MWSPLLNILEMIGRIRSPFVRFKSALSVGDPNAQDFLNSDNWRKYLDARELSRVWGPRMWGGTPHSPWTPFHCLTLFIGLDYLQHAMVWPCKEDPFPVRGFRAPDWMDAQTLIFVDLPGPESVALGAALAVSGCDLVCTFNNWPHPKGLMRPEQTLAALLRYAALLTEKRRSHLTPAPVAWLCDARRLGTMPGRPGQFDNRYYIENGVIPGPKFLRERGISKVVYVTARPGFIVPDLSVHLEYYHKERFTVFEVGVDDKGGLHAPMRIVPKARPQAFAGFFKSSAGGFGGTVPQPSSSSGGGGGG